MNYTLLYLKFAWLHALYVYVYINSKWTALIALLRPLKALYAPVLHSHTHTHAYADGGGCHANLSIRSNLGSSILRKDTSTRGLVFRLVDDLLYLPSHVYVI